jgi:signal transduction protein with GAF and PtsI domain
VLGRVGVVPTTTGLGAAPVELERTLGRLREDLGRAMKRLSSSDVPAVGAALDRFALTLCDARLRERLVDAAGQPDGLRSVAKEYARAPYKLGTVAESAEYVADIEELCVLLADPRSLRPGAIWIADRIHAFVAIAAVARGASALVASDAVSPAAIAIARADGIPVVSDVPGLFGWARPGDLLAVDGTTGVVLVQPPATDVEKLRSERAP